MKGISALDLLLDNHYITLVLIIAYSIRLIDHKSSRDSELKYFWITVISCFALVLQDVAESIAAQDPSLIFWRTLLSIAGYTLRPIAALGLLLVVCPPERRTWKLWIPAGINAAVNLTAFFSPLTFYFSDDYAFRRGPLGYVVFIVGIMYILQILIATWKRFYNRKLTERAILLICALSCLGATAVDANYGGHHLTEAIMISSIFFYIFLRSHDNRTDQLTLLQNRFAFYEDINNLNRNITAVASLDMNGLKALNDTQGHLEGDKALQEIGRCLSRINDHDTIAYRIGGDEFIILFLQQDETSVQHTLNRVNEDVTAAGYSLSIGYAKRAAGEEIGETIHASDQSMYDSKARYYQQSGKNRRRRRQPEPDKSIGLLDGLDFLRPLQAKIEDFRDGWCVVDICIENYKHFADWYGMESAHLLLSRIAEALRENCNAEGGHPGYIGQAEFCLIIPYDEKQLRALYDKISEVIASMSHIDSFCPLMGIALIDDTGSDLLEFINKAALTVDSVKGTSGEHIRIYEDEQHRKNEYEYRILDQFQHAIENGEISFFLQPQVRVSNGKIVSAESLARWQLPDGSWNSPGDFVPVLEKYGIVSKLDKYIWESVCIYQSNRLKVGKPLLPISINVSQIDIRSFDVPAFLEGLMKKYALPASCLEIEITESAYSDNIVIMQDVVSRLHELGHIVLMDDFGSGYSSLNMLRSINVDVIKLDAQFLRISSGEERKGISIIESIVNMTNNLTTPIIVEGVEKEEQIDYLKGLGCQYMQGYYFYRPMPPEQYDMLIDDSEKADLSGFRFKANQQLHIREFMDENIYSDYMLNNILGPVVFYNLHGDDIDIVRFNEQFFDLVGISVEEFEIRRHGIQKYMPESDQKELLRLLNEAEVHLDVGARGNVRAIRPSGAVVWMSMHLFFINEDAGGKKFYASCHDITEMQVATSELPGAYYRAALNDDFDLLFTGPGFHELTGYSDLELKVFFDNKLIALIHPDDIEGVRSDAKAIINGKSEYVRPYRIKRKAGDYIYVAEQCQVSDRFGSLCWQAMAVDVSEVMKLRNQMMILSKYMAGTILLLRRTEGHLEYEVAVHGLYDDLGLDEKELEEALNGGTFCKWVKGYKDIPHHEYTEQFIKTILNAARDMEVTLPNGRTLILQAHADPAMDSYYDVEYIVDLRLKAE